ncbi:immunoglobulin-like domain-containing protein [Aeromonas media]|uniref:immunoglobulin-like domain-containing protein n=2 Tax=Aeromonas TaxID=642 RepID=UPI0038D0B681
MKNHHTLLRASVPLLGWVLLAPLAMAQQSSTTGAFRKDNSAPQIYSQEGLVNNFAQMLPLGATFSPLLTAWDAEDGDLTARISQKSTVNTQVPGSYVAQYQVKDDGLPAEDGFKG